MRRHNLLLASTVEDVRRKGYWPLVVGGDCSVLLGALAGARRSEPLSLVHIDGHSDFRHPGNYDPNAALGAVAGMDLALATGRGEAIMTDWPGVVGALVPDAQVVQIGERENLDADYAWPDIAQTQITSIDVRTARQHGPQWILQQARTVLDRRPDWPFWVHFDVDVLDQAIMPAVDTPGSPGLDPSVVASLLRSLLDDARCVGMTVTIFDPDLDPHGTYALLIVDLLRQSFADRASTQ
jgi:arginase